MNYLSALAGIIVLAHTATLTSTLFSSWCKACSPLWPVFQYEAFVFNLAQAWTPQPWLLLLCTLYIWHRLYIVSILISPDSSPCYCLVEYKKCHEKNKTQFSKPQYQFCCLLTPDLCMILVHFCPWNYWVGNIWHKNVCHVVCFNRVYLLLCTAATHTHITELPQ